MAYISPKEVKEIRNNIKAAFPAKDGWKFSITGQNYSTVCVCILEAPHKFDLDGKDDQSVNHFYINEHWNESDAAILNKIMDIINAVKCNFDRNAGDHSADYAGWNYYIDLNIGKWNKAFKFTGSEVVASQDQEEKESSVEYDGKVVSFQGIEMNTDVTAENIEFAENMIAIENDSNKQKFKIELLNGETNIVTAISFIDAINELGNNNIKSVTRIVDTKEKLAREFSSILQNELQDDDMKEIIIRNIQEESKDICHSHDFIDSNVIMMDAFERIFKRRFNFSSASDHDMINNAWELTISNNFYFPFSFTEDQKIG